MESWAVFPLHLNLAGPAADFDQQDVTEAQLPSQALKLTASQLAPLGSQHDERKEVEQFQAFPPQEVPTSHLEENTGAPRRKAKAPDELNAFSGTFQPSAATS